MGPFVGQRGLCSCPAQQVRSRPGPTFGSTLLTSCIRRGSLRCRVITDSKPRHGLRLPPAQSQIRKHRRGALLRRLILLHHHNWDRDCSRPRAAAEAASGRNLFVPRRGRHRHHQDLQLLRRHLPRRLRSGGHSDVRWAARLHPPRACKHHEVHVVRHLRPSVRLLSSLDRAPSIIDPILRVFQIGMSQRC